MVLEFLEGLESLKTTFQSPHSGLYRVQKECQA
jgi:hypothetical protein